MNPEDAKELARQRRQKRLYDMWDGRDYSTRWIPPKDLYKRSMKHKPQTVHDWEELED